MRLCESNDCTGCMACLNVCPCGALTVVSDSEGFDHPQLNEALCIDCGLCEKACPVLQPVERSIKKQHVYACWTNDKQLRLASSSGGLFTELSRVVLAKHGIVFGVALDAKLTAYHTYVTTEEELSALRGSKYVQSRIGEGYKKAKQFLTGGKTVLFSGTPCQIAGLRGYLGEDYDNLFTADLVCHGVPSPLMFEEYKSYMERRLDARIENIKFRCKQYSWIFYNIAINDNSDNKNTKSYLGTYYSDPYIRGFLRDYFLRPSCHDCRFANLDRMGDVTMADYWGFKGKEKEDRNYEELGVSLAIVNNEKGIRLFGACKAQLTCYHKTIEDASRGNKTLSQPFPRPAAREAFWEDYHSMPFEEVVGKWMKPERIPWHSYLSSNFKNTAFIKAIVFLLRLRSRVINRVTHIFRVR